MLRKLAILNFSKKKLKLKTVHMRNITDRNKFTLQSKFLFMIGKVVKITGLNACCVSLTVMQRMRNITEKAVHACISRSSWQIEEFKFEKKKGCLPP